MIDTSERISVLEFNVRFGDPETAVLLARLDADLVPYLLGAARGDLGALADAPPPVVDEPALGVVLAAPGYPGTPQVGAPIEGLAEAAAEGAVVLHAGTSLRDGKVVTSGGRVLCVTARGADIDEAAARAYRAVDRIRFPGAQHRRDIGKAARKLSPDPRDSR
jgi:phosphoribosylamine--glycine ligase